MAKMIDQVLLILTQGLVERRSNWLLVCGMVDLFDGLMTRIRIADIICRNNLLILLVVFFSDLL